MFKAKKTLTSQLYAKRAAKRAAAAPRRAAAKRAARCYE